VLAMGCQLFAIRAFVVTDQTANKRGQRLLVASKALDRRLHGLVRVESLHGHRVASILGKNREEGELGATIALTERVYRIEVSEEMCGLVREGVVPLKCF
jgi:hypothetical protein